MSQIINDINKSKLIAYGLPVIAYCLILLAFLKQAYPTADRELIDFDCFYLVGKLFWIGKLNDAYDMRTFIPHYRDLYATSSFMPWTYPPQFNLVTAVLAKFTKPVAFLIFVALTFSAYLVLLKRMAHAYFPLMLILMFPCILMNGFVGQNGFLTAFLIGVFFYLYHHGRPSAGYVLGLLVIKPHFALGIGLLAILDKQWGVVLRALLMLLLSTVLCTVLFGGETWSAFLTGLHQSRQFLAIGAYPLERMVSAYAMLRRLGIPSEIAFFLHVVEVGMIVYLLFRGHAEIEDLKLRSAVFIVGSLFISPYLYDYDMAVMGIVLAFSLSPVLRFASKSEQCWLFASVLMIASWKIVLSIPEHLLSYSGYGKFEHPVTFGNLFLLVVFFILLKIAAASIQAKMTLVNS